MHNPLEQFAIKKLLQINVGSLDLSFTNSALMMLFVFSIVFLCAYVMSRVNGYRVINTHGISRLDTLIEGDEIAKRDIKKKIVPKYVAMISEYVYIMVHEMTKGTAGPRSEKFVPLIFTIYIFILLCNLLGLIPGGYTVTSSIAITFAISGIMILLFTIIGFIKHKWRYLSIFIPHGTPLFMAPLMFLIELFAYLARPVSLALRLSANMTAGHIILKVMASMVILGGIMGALPLAFLVIMTGFEIFIAVLQAYIFSILACVYLNTALELH